MPTDIITRFKYEADTAELENTTRVIETNSSAIAKFNLNVDAAQKKIEQGFKEVNEQYKIQEKTISAVNKKILETTSVNEKALESHKDQVISINQAYKDQTGIVDDQAKSLTDLTTELVRQRIIYKQMEEQFIDIAKVKDNVIINPDEVIEATKALEGQAKIVAAVEQRVESFTSDLKKLTGAQDQVEKSSTKMSKGIEKMTTASKKFIKAGLVGIVILIGNELRKVQPIVDAFERGINALTSGVSALVSGGNIFDAISGSDAALVQLQALRKIERDLGITLSKNNVEIQKQNNLLSSSASFRDDRAKALEEINRLELDGVTKQLALENRRLKLFQQQNASRIALNDVAVLQEEGAIIETINGLKTQQSALNQQLIDQNDELFGTTSLEQSTSDLEDYTDQFIKLSKVSILDNGDVALLTDGSTNIDELIKNIVRTKKEINDLQIDQEIALATNEFERLNSIVTKFTDSINTSVSSNSIVDPVIIKTLQDAQNQLEILSLQVSAIVADGALETYAADIAILEREVSELVGSGDLLLAAEQLKELEQVRAAKTELEENFSFIIKEEKDLLDARKALYDEGLTDILEFNKKREGIEIDGRLAVIAKLKSIEGTDSKRFKELELEEEELNNRKAALDEIYRQLKIQRELGYASEIVGITEQLTDVINANELARFNYAIALQEERVSAALAIADDGNSQQLQLEEERLDKLTEAREKAAKKQEAINKVFALAQIGINTAQTISNIQLGATRVFAESGISSPIVLPITLAIVTGLISAAATLFTPPQLYEGTDYSVEKTLGYRAGRDSHLVNIDNKERVVTGELNDQVSHLSSKELIKYAKIGEAVSDSPLNHHYYEPLPVLNIPKQAMMTVAPSSVAAKHQTDQVLQSNKNIEKLLSKNLKKQDEMIDAFNAIDINYGFDAKGHYMSIKKMFKDEQKMKKRIG